MNELQQIQRYFEYYCHRAPDAASLRIYAEHLARGISLHTLHLAIAHSDEARSKAGQRRPGHAERVADLDAHYAQALAASRSESPAMDAMGSESVAPAAQEAPMSDAEIYLTYVYIALLGRRPDQGGMQGYMGAIRNGLPLEQIVQEIYLSGEALALNGRSQVTERIVRLQRLARFAPLKRAGNWLIQAMLAGEVQRLWQRRLTAAA